MKLKKMKNTVLIALFFATISTVIYSYPLDFEDERQV